MGNRLDGEIAIVFGAGSSGAAMSNGRAAALAFADQGAVVAAVDRNTAEAELTAKEIRARGGHAIALTADVTNEGDVQATLEAVTGQLGRPTVLHNNVGAAHQGELTTLERSAWDSAIAVNLTGVFLACKHVIPVMSEAEKGSIINVSSIAGIRSTGYNYPAYMAAKAAVNQLTVAMALQYAAQGIRVNAIMPGLIDTPIVSEQVIADQALVAQARAQRHAASPTGKMGSPWDIANAAVFLASAESAYINGVCLAVDGGLSARVAT